MSGNILPHTWPRLETRFRRSVYPSARGFTLIELLAVLAIIALLTALLLPVLSRARAHAESLQCRSQVRQWGLAIWMYGEERGDLFPYEGRILTGIDTAANREAWYNTLPPLLGMEALAALYARSEPPRPGARSWFMCPSPAALPTATLTPTRPYFTYGFNNRMDPNGPAQFRRSQMLEPVLTVVFTENSEHRFPSASGIHTPARHRGRANLAFGDGHVEAVRSNDFARSLPEDQDSRLEWERGRAVYWYPFPGAPR